MVNTACYIAGEPVRGDQRLTVKSPWSGEAVCSVVQAGKEDVQRAIRAAVEWKKSLTRFQRHEILEKARVEVDARREELACLITSEAGLCLRESRYEVGRASDVLRFAAIEALRD